MRIFYCKPWMFLKLLSLWLLSVLVTVAVLLYFRPLPVVTENGQRASHGRPEMESLLKSKPQKIAPTSSLFQKAQKLLKVNPKKPDRLDHLFKRSNRSLENLQMFPKLQQTHMINTAYINRPELKAYLKTKFNLTDGTAKAGPLEPAMMPGVGLKKNIPLQSQLQRGDLNIVVNVRDKCILNVPFMLIFVHSAVRHTEQRDLIRQTWAKVESYKGHVIRTIFVLAQPENVSGTDTLAVNDDVIKERQAYDDIVQGDFIDHYRNLTTKHLLAYQWLVTHCHNVKYVIKVDDDTLVNVFRTVDFLASDKNPLLQTNDLIYCSAFINQGPRRDTKDKWYVSRQEYPGEKYPTYCEGFAYVTTPGVVIKLYTASASTPRYWIDDVYVTGMLAESTGVRHRQFRDPYGYNVMHASSLENRREVVQHALFVLAKYKLDSSAWRELWDTALEGHSKEEYWINSRYVKQNVHIPHHTL